MHSEESRSLVKRLEYKVMSVVGCEARASGYAVGIRKNFFALNVVRHWNRLPKEEL